MVKKTEHLETAEKLYVEKQLTLREIAARLPVSYITLRRWKDREGWEQKKKDLLLSAEEFHKELFELGRELSVEIRKDMREGREVKPARYYALGRIMDTVNKTHRYEKKVRSMDEGERKDVSLKEILVALNDRLFGDE